MFRIITETDNIKGETHGGGVGLRTGWCRMGAVIAARSVIPKWPRFHGAAVPKQNNVFAVPLGRWKATLYGNHFRFRPSQRVARKFKAKASIDL